MRRTTTLLAAALLAAAPAAAQEEAITFCAGTDNLPLSHPEVGIEVEFARALAAQLGAEARFAWAEHAESPDAALLEGRCDAALGAVVDPGPMADGRAPPGTALTAPYYGAGYVLIRRAGAPPARTLEELGETRVAVEMESVPIYTLKQRGNRVYALDDYEAVIEAVADGRVEYGYVWGPLGAWILRDRSDVEVAGEFEPVERWHFALLVREGEEELRRRLDAAIHALLTRGEVERIFAGHSVPYLSPGAPAAAAR